MLFFSCILLALMYIKSYNPPINFRVILLATLRHVVQNHWTVITQ